MALSDIETKVELVAMMGEGKIRQRTNEPQSTRRVPAVGLAVGRGESFARAGLPVGGPRPYADDCPSRRGLPIRCVAAPSVVVKPPFVGHEATRLSLSSVRDVLRIAQ